MALAVGLADPDGLSHLPYSTLLDWQMYLSEGPFIWRVLDLHLARLTATLSNVFRDTRRRASPYQTKEFMVFRPVVYEPSGEELFDQLLFINKLYGGQVIDHRQEDG